MDAALMESVHIWAMCEHGCMDGLSDHAVQTSDCRCPAAFACVLHVDILGSSSQAWIGVWLLGPFRLVYRAGPFAGQLIPLFPTRAWIFPLRAVSP